MPRLMFAILLSAAAFAQPPAAPKLRLPPIARPLAYDVDLRLDPAQDGFSGRVRINVEVLQPTPILWLHSKELAFTDTRIDGTVARAEPTGNDFVAITPERALQPGRVALSIDYTGRVSRTLTDGVFRQQENGDWYLFTKFEPVTARRAFPCFDEPSFKTPWQITLHLPSNLKAFSNTPLASEAAEPDGRKVVRFKRSQPLPSYLVAFAAGPFEVVDVAPLGKKRVPGSIIVPRGRGADAAAAASEIPKAIEVLEDYFGIPYPYEKLDHIVVPITTSWGAMENAGLIAFNQYLLARPDENTVPRQRGRLDGVVHEISHQWVGNLVTTAWWDDIWLNEGFASWITSKLIDRWHPEWKVRSSQVSGANSAMGSDSLVSARKVRQPIEAPGDIGNAFDGITYVKGAAILRMFENWIGEETFRKGVHEYLTSHAWGNATTADLLASLSHAAGREISAAFSSFLDQGGVPLVTAGVRCDSPRPMLKLAQQRFLPIGSTGSASAVWKLPVCVRWSEGTAERRECVLFNEPAAEFPLEGASTCPAWFFANDNAAGYYRAAYDSPWFDRLLESGIGKLALHEQAGLLRNMQALVGAGKFDARQALSLAMRTSDSNEREIVTAALGLAGSIGPAITDDLWPDYARFLRDWLGKRAHELGWLPKPGDSEDTKEIRRAVAPLVAIGGQDPELGAEARRLAEAWLKDRKAVDRDTAGYVLAAAARHGDRAFFDRLVAELRKTKDQTERYTIIFALGAFPDPAIMRSALDLVLNGGEGIDAREVSGVITGQWRETRETAWQFVKQNFDALNQRLPGARGIPYGATLPYVANGFCETPRAAEVEAFFKPRIATLPGGDRNLARTLESIRLCAMRREALSPSVREFLKTGDRRK